MAPRAIHHSYLPLGILCSGSGWRFAASCRCSQPLTVAALQCRLCDQKGGFFPGNAGGVLRCSVCSAVLCLPSQPAAASCSHSSQQELREGRAVPQQLRLWWWHSVSSGSLGEPQEPLLFPRAVQLNLNQVLAVPLSPAYSRKHVVNSSN